MTPEKQKELVEVYPRLFQDLSGPVAMKLFGFECDDGWFELLKELIGSIRFICESQDLDIRLNQVKEKYGTLRFYLDSETDEICELVNEAEKKSAKICESCGHEGQLRVSRSWWYTRCDECFIKCC
jgi:hypothetical protein